MGVGRVGAKDEGTPERDKKHARSSRTARSHFFVLLKRRELAPRIAQTHLDTFEPVVHDDSYLKKRN
jgi:hypothetical protein